MENTDWKRPVTADGEIDVRVGDRWDFGGTIATVLVRYKCSFGDMLWVHNTCGLFQPQNMHIESASRLLSRDSVPWIVPGDQHKGRWVASVTLSEGEMRRAWYIEPMDRMVWLPDAATPAEPVTPAEPQPGERWEDGRMVYRPIHDDGDGTLRYLMPNGTSLYLRGAHGKPGFAGYYYPAHGDKASAIRSDSLRYRNPHTGKCSTRYSPGDKIVRPTHVCFVKEGE